MSQDVFVVVEHLKGAPSEVSFEMIGKGKELASALGGECVAVVLGKDAGGIASACGGADRALLLEHDTLAEFNPEAHAKALRALLAERKPRMTLVSSSSKGMDLAADVALGLGVPVATNVGGIAVEDGTVVVTSQLYGGKLWAEAEVSGETCVLSVLAGGFPADAGRGGGAPNVETVAPEGLDGLRTTFEALVTPEAADVDITKEDVLVSVGRGIESADNLEIVKELADAIGCPLSASRPVVDAGWLPKSRQVGKSGVSVKPKIYIAIGISGAPEHIQGMKDASTIVAINTDPNAPIFDVAHYGVTADLFDVVPALAEKIQAAKG